MSKLLLDTLSGRPTDRRPLWIMRQAGRYLPEYRALRADHSFEELSGSPELAAEVTLLPFQRFALDAAILFADLMSPVPALGLPVRFDPGPVLERTLRSRADIDALPDVDPEAIAPSVIETLRLVKPRLADGVALLGFAGAPLSLAAYLVEGHGQSGFPALRALAAADPKAFETLMAKLARLAAAYLIEQAKAGADAVQVFDSWGGLLSRGDWQRLVRPHLEDLLEELSRAGVPTILFFQDAAHLLDSLLELPAEALSLDWRLDLPAVRRLSPRRVLQGNLDPAVLLAGPEVTRQAALALLRSMPAKGHIFNLGHGILPQTPLDSVHALVEAVHQEVPVAA
ncbi:MAG: uroporphyrinogen decarboxylase [Thermoanaerobaculia bacterium]